MVSFVWGPLRASAAICRESTTSDRALPLVFFRLNETIQKGNGSDVSILESFVIVADVGCGIMLTMSDQTPILFTQTGCADSRKVHEWLNERGVAFVERNVTGDMAAAKALMATGVFATPLLVVHDERVLGFRPDLLAAALVKATPE